MALELWEITVTGHVQGVGYRYFAVRLATKGGFGGYAMNMPDGAVMIEAEGEAEELERFTASLWNGPGRVDHVAVLKYPYSGKYTSFGIKY